eukprot:UN2548
MAPTRRLLCMDLGRPRPCPSSACSDDSRGRRPCCSCACACGRLCAWVIGCPIGCARRIPCTRSGPHVFRHMRACIRYRPPALSFRTLLRVSIRQLALC